MKKSYHQYAVLLASLALTGCAGVSSQTASDDAAQTEALAVAEQRITTLEQQLNRSQEELDAARSASAAQVASVSNSSTTSSGDGALFPPNPKVGECYARVLIPASYESTTERVLVREESERIEIIPARYEPGTERVLAKEASTRLEVVPAVYETVTERVMVRPASKKIVEVPAKYSTETERVLDKPAHTIWKRGPAGSQSGSVVAQQTTDTGEIMCLVEVPATYKTISRQVLVSPARTDEVDIPAEYKTVTKRVLKTPATTREVEIPAEYMTVDTTKLVSPAKENRIKIPAEYGTVTKTKKVSEERLEWRSVWCEVNMTASNVSSLQRALSTAGYYDGPVDGIIGPKTLKGAKSYANAKGLPAGSNYIAMDVIKSLGLKI